MIKVQYTYTVDTDQFPISWILTSDNDCGTATEVSGTSTDSNIDLEFILDSEDCFNNISYSLVATDNCGSTTSVSIHKDSVLFPLDNPCSNFLTGLSNNNNLGFTASVLSGVYRYNWIFNDLVFEETSNSNPDGGYLELQYKTGEPIGATETVTVIVTNASGCERSDSVTFANTQATGEVFSLSMSCSEILKQVVGTNGTLNRVSNLKQLTFTPTAGKTIDWGTLVFENVPTNVFVIHEGLGKIRVYANTLVSSGTRIIKARVKDSTGLYSQYTLFVLYVPNCPVVETPVTITDNYVVPTGSVVSDVLYSNIENLTASFEDIDWDTFTFIAGTGQTLVSATELTTANASVEFLPSRKAKYTITALPVAACADIVKWRISDTNGTISNEGRLYFDYEPSTAPVTSAIANCAPCGGVRVLTPSASTTGVFNDTTFNLTSSPSRGSASYTAPNLTYIANLQESGSDVFGYTFTNPDGVTSNTSTITITVICAGADNSDTICNSGTINFEDYLSTYATAGGTWSASFGNPGTPSLATPTAVDFTGEPVGTYAFTYTVNSGSCNDRMNLVITVTTGSANNACANAISMAHPISSISNATIVACDTITNVFTSGNLPSTWDSTTAKDVWFKFTTGATNLNTTITIDGSSFGAQGITNPQVAIYNSDPCTIGTATLVSQAATTDNTRSVSTNITLSAITTYHVRVSAPPSNLGKFNIYVNGV